METILDGMIARPDEGNGELTPLGEMLFNPATLARMPEQLRCRLTNVGASNPSYDFYERYADAYNGNQDDIGNLNKHGPYGGYDCPKCMNRGFFAEKKMTAWGPNIVTRECDCMEKRRYLRRMRKSGLSELAERHTLESWQCREPWQRSLLDMVKRYAEHPEGWLLLSGTPGTGKTHLCTALCNALMERGLPVRYMLWRETATKAKAVVNDNEAYEAIVGPLRRVKVLYIDDFWKCGKASPTVGDVNLACDIIYARYNDSSLLTIISTEMEIGSILDTDEGIGSRIAERVKGRYANLTRKQNWRRL